MAGRLSQPTYSEERAPISDLCCGLDFEGCLRAHASGIILKVQRCKGETLHGKGGDDVQGALAHWPTSGRRVVQQLGGGLQTPAGCPRYLIHPGPAAAPKGERPPSHSGKAGHRTQKKGRPHRLGIRIQLAKRGRRPYATAPEGKAALYTDSQVTGRRVMASPIRPVAVGGIPL
jgi:hypothetical protein